MITKDDFKKIAVDIVDKHFPKGKSKERGEASLLVADLIMLHEDIIKELYVRKTNTKKNEGGNVKRPDIPKLSEAEGTIRSRMPRGSSNGATYRVGTRNVPSGK